MKHIVPIILCSMLGFISFHAYAGYKHKFKLTKWELTCLEWFKKQQEKIKSTQPMYENPAPPEITLSYTDEFERVDTAIKEYVDPVYAQYTLANEPIHYDKRRICSLLLRIKLALDEKKNFKMGYKQCTQLHLFECYSK